MNKEGVYYLKADNLIFYFISTQINCVFILCVEVFYLIKSDLFYY